MIDRRLFRSASFRFGMVYAALLAISATALALFLWWSTAGLLDRQTEAAIHADAQGLLELLEENGLAALATTIDDRLVQNVDDDAVYLLADSQMQRITGNLQRWPSLVSQTGIGYELAVMRAGMRSLVQVQRIDLPHGFYLLVGRDIQVRAQLSKMLTDALLWAVVVVGLLATAGALVVRSLFRRTLANISATTAAIAGGNLAQRVQLSGRGDEFDQMAEVINDMLARISRLMDGVRQVSNAIAHDLRTPITRARTRLEDAALHAETKEDLRAAVERATVDLDGIVAIFQALLRIAEIEAGSRRSSFARLDIAPLLVEVADLYGVVAEERGVALRVEAPGYIPAYGDKALIQQAIANMVDNAVKFSSSGGVARLSVSLDGAIRVMVTDQGRAFPSPTGRRRPSGSIEAKPRAAHRALGLGCRWFWPWRNCTAAACSWLTTTPAFGPPCRFRFRKTLKARRDATPKPDVTSRLGLARGGMWH